MSHPFNSQLKDQLINSNVSSTYTKHNPIQRNTFSMYPMITWSQTWSLPKPKIFLTEHSLGFTPKKAKAIKKALTNP